MFQYVEPESPLTPVVLLSRQVWLTKSSMMTPLFSGVCVSIKLQEFRCNVLAGEISILMELVERASKKNRRRPEQGAEEWQLPVMDHGRYTNGQGALCISCKRSPIVTPAKKTKDQSSVDETSHHDGAIELEEIKLLHPNTNVGCTSSTAHWRLIPCTLFSSGPIIVY